MLEVTNYQHFKEFLADGVINKKRRFLDSLTVELSRRSVARDLPFCKGLDTRFGRL